MTKKHTIKKSTQILMLVSISMLLVIPSGALENKLQDQEIIINNDYGSDQILTYEYSFSIPVISNIDSIEKFFNIVYKEFL